MGWAGTADHRAVIMNGNLYPGPKNFGRKFWVANCLEWKDLGLKIWGNAKNAADKALMCPRGTGNKTERGVH